MLFRSFVSLSILLTVCLSQEEEVEISKGQQVISNEQRIKDENQMSYSNIKSFTFPCGRYDEFVVKPSISKELKF